MGFLSDGLVVIDELLLLFEQLGAVGLGDEVTGQYQFAVIGFPFCEEPDVVNRSAPFHCDCLWAWDSFRGEDRY